MEAKFKIPCGSSLASTVRTASYPWLSKTAAPVEETPARESVDCSEWNVMQVIFLSYIIVNITFKWWSVAMQIPWNQSSLKYVDAVGPTKMCIFVYLHSITNRNRNFMHTKYKVTKMY